MTVTLDSLADFNLDAACRVAWGGEAVRFSGRARTAMADGRAQLLRLLEDPDVVIYGVTSGYGQNAHQRFTPEERRAHAARPSVQTAASWGDPLPDRVSRAIVFARLANFVEGHAGITPALAEEAAAMLDDMALPPVPAGGQGGAGEILALSHLFLPLMKAWDLHEKDALSLINGSPAATGLVADAALAGTRRLDQAAQVFAFALEAFNAPLGHFEPALGEAWANPHDAWALDRISALIGGGHGGARRSYQAPVSFRIAPRMLGQSHLAMTMATEVASRSLRAVTDNPVLLPPDPAHPNGRAISTGGYHNAQAPMAMDAITAASVNLCVLTGRMLDAMLWGPVSGLPHQLGVADGLPYLGCLGMALTGYEEEARGLATATLLPGSAGGGFGQNDVASPVFAAWSKQERTGELLELSLAGLATVSSRAYDVTGRPVPEALGWLEELVRQSVPLDDGLRPLGPATHALAEALRGRIYRA